MSFSKRLFQLGLFRRDTARAEMNEELEFHIEARVAQLISRGLTPEEARSEALRRLGSNTNDARRQLGNSAALKERRLDMRERWYDLVDDVRYALRGLARNPAFAVVAVLTLAIGIGANTSIYSAVDALLLRSLPFREPGRLMDVVQLAPEDGALLFNGVGSQFSYPRYTFYRNEQKSFALIAAHTSLTTTITGAEPERVTIEEVTGKYLATLGVPLATGHDFPADIDNAPGARKLAIISDALWQRRYNADPVIVGKTLLLNNEAWEIIGVLPQTFRGLSGRADALLNLTARPAASLEEAWSLEFSVIARLKPGVSPTQALSEAQVLGPRMNAAFPPAAGTLTTSKAPSKWTIGARPLNTIRVATGLRKSLLVLFGAVAMVLLIACVNLANLQVARALARKQEIAVRLAIGAPRERLVRMLVTESAVLATLGGIASIVVAVLGTRVLSAINPQETLRVQGLEGGIGVVGFENIRLDGSALVFTFGVTLLVGIVFGLIPAIRATRSDLTRDLRSGSSGGGTGRGVGVGRRSLVVVEVATALVLLAGSGLMVRSLRNLLQVNPGFDSKNVLTLRLSVPGGVVAPDSMPGFYSQLQSEIAAVPGVESVSLADCAPLNNGCNGTIMTFADRPPSASGNAMVGVHWVSPSWFGTMRVPLKRGRMFTDADRLGTQKVLLINEESARKLFPGEDPIGKRVAVYQGGFDKGAEIIGIVGDVRFGTIDSTARPDAYISYGQARISRMIIFVRTTNDPALMAPTLRAVIRRFAPRNPLYDVRTMSSRVATASAQAQFSAMLLAMFAAVALTLAMTGIYGVMSFAVAQRTRELGIRVALGADKGRVLSLVLKEGAQLAIAGVTIGLVAALAVTRVLSTMLFGVASTDALTYGAMIILLAGAVLAASWIPARRAASVDPMIALRNG